MSDHSKPQIVTTYLLLKAHDPSDPPSITDAGSQAGQAFNQVLRCIAAFSGFHSQLFGWPPEVGESEDVNMNDFVASTRPNLLAIFVNWENEVSATNFLSPSSLKQAFQGFGTFFEVPTAATVNRPSLSLTDAPLAFNICWNHGQPARVLERTKHPLKVKLESSSASSGESPIRNDETDVGAAGLIKSAHTGLSTTVLIENVREQHSSPPTSEELYLSLMRTRHCSRIKESLYSLLRSHPGLIATSTK